MEIECLPVRYDSTCITLDLPRKLYCEVCLNENDPLKNKRKKRKTDNIRHRNYRYFCKQFWDTKWIVGTRSTDSTVQLHYNIRNFLKAKQDLNLNVLPYGYKLRIRESESIISNQPSLDATNNSSHAVASSTSSSSRAAAVSSSSSSSRIAAASSSLQQSSLNVPFIFNTRRSSSVTTTVRTSSELLDPTVMQSEVVTSDQTNQTNNNARHSHSDNSNTADVNTVIVDSIKKFIKDVRGKGRPSNNVTKSIHLLLTACTTGNPIHNEKIRVALGLSQAMFQKYTQDDSSCETVALYTAPPLIKRINRFTQLQMRCIDDFCHSSESSNIDSNSRRVVTVNNIDHATRVWRVKTQVEQYALFKESETVNRYTLTYGSNFKLPQISFFLRNCCKCMTTPTMQSCVDIITSSVYHYMQAVAKFIRDNKAFERQLRQCECDQHLSLPFSDQWHSNLEEKRVEDFIDDTCCNRVRHPLLTHGFGTSKREPHLLRWDCVHGLCNECGIENNLGMSQCPVLNYADDEVRVLEWAYINRQGKNKSGKQNTQLELTTKTHPLSLVISKLKDATNKCRIHQAQYEWRNIMQKIDKTMTNSDTSQVVFTDFGATLDLMASEKDNSSINNHAVVCIFMVTYNWRNVKFNRRGVGLEEVEDETVVNDCDKWIFFGDTLSKGKKNDHIFHRSCLTHINKFYNEKRRLAGQEPIKVTVVWTDNCPTQYKCRQNFSYVSTFSSDYDNECILIHKFAQKFRFKGTWDATGRLIKLRILNNELNNHRCANAWMCFLLLRDQLSKDEFHELMRKLDECERTGDEGILKNTTFTCKCTYIGYATEDKQEYETKSRVYEHVVHTDRSEIPDVNVLKDTLKIAQVQGEYKQMNGEWGLVSAKLPCSCQNCRENPTDVDQCSYNQCRGIIKHSTLRKPDSIVTETVRDDYGLNQLTVPELRIELSERGYPNTARMLRQELVELLKTVIEEEAEHDDVGSENEDDNDDNGVMEFL